MMLTFQKKLVERYALACVAIFVASATLGVAASAAELGSNIGDVDQPLWYHKPTERTLELAKIDDLSDTVVSKGPYGAEGVLARSITITDEQRQKIKEGDFTVAISMGWMGDDWASEQLRGMRTTFDKLGIEIIATTNANWNDAKQISDLKAIAALNPDLLLSIPLNAATTANAYQALADAGTKIVFMDQPAKGMKPGEDYVGLASSDNLTLGMYAADLLARQIEGKGKVAALYFANDFYVTNLRYIGFIARLMAKYPELKLVATQGFDNPNKGLQVTLPMLTTHPNLDGMYGSWSVPAMGAAAAAKITGRDPDSFPIVNGNFDQIVAANLAEGGFIAGIASQRPYDQAVAEAKIGALALIGVDPPDYVVVPPVKAYRENLPQAYKKVYGKPLPQEMMAELKEDNVLNSAK